MSVTIGIENSTQNIGIQYLFNTDYNPTATPVVNQYSIKFTTEPPFDTGIVPGDSNCDGNTNVLDAVVMINYILGYSPEPFCFANADLNNDGNINILDVVGTVNIILGSSKNHMLSNADEPAHIFMNQHSIELFSKGNLAGLQFEIEGLSLDQITLALQGYEFRIVEKDNKLLGLIFSFDNKPLPEGKIRLFDIQPEHQIGWGEVIAANIHAEKVEIYLHNEYAAATGEEATELTVFPNPFSHYTTIGYTLKQSGFINLGIYNTTGELVRTLYEGTQQAGAHNVEWNELNNAGSRVLPGVYICRFQTENDIKAGIIIMLK